MKLDALTNGIRRRREFALFLGALAVGAAAVLLSVWGWLPAEEYGDPITVRPAPAPGRAPEVVFPPFPAENGAGKKDPFAGGATAAEPGGKGRIPLPPLPPLAAEMPPVPMARPIDLLREGVR